MVFAISFLKNDKPKRQTLIAITQSPNYLDLLLVLAENK